MCCNERVPRSLSLAPHLHQFDMLAKDTDTPMVRRAVASNVGNFAGVVEASYLLTDVVPVFEALASDDQDNVRLLAVEQAGKVAKALVDQVRIPLTKQAGLELSLLTLIHGGAKAALFRRSGDGRGYLLFLRH